MLAVNEGYNSLSAALEASAVSGAPLLTVRFMVNRGRVTMIEYRKSFELADRDDETHTSELTAMVALLRQYGRSQGSGRVPFEIRIVPTHEYDQVFVSERLAAYLQRRAMPPETVPAALVKQLTGDVSVAENERRSELGDLKVEEVRKLASSLKVVGAWKERKATLIDRIIVAEGAAPTAP